MKRKKSACKLGIINEKNISDKTSCNGFWKLLDKLDTNSHRKNNKHGHINMGDWIKHSKSFLNTNSNADFPPDDITIGPPDSLSLFQN